MDGTHTSDCFVAFAWTGKNGERRLVLVNYSDHQSQCYVTIPWRDLAGRQWQLRDQMGTAVYEKSGDDLVMHGLYLDTPAWAYNVFDLHDADTLV